MDLKRLEKANNALQAIKKLDAEIIEIDRVAMLIANKETKCTFDLKILDLTKKEEDAAKVRFDGDGSIVQSDRPFNMGFSFFDMYNNHVKKILSGASGKQEEITHKLCNELSVNATMAILGVLLHEKQTRRDRLLKLLSNYGVLI